MQEFPDIQELPPPPHSTPGAYAVEDPRIGLDGLSVGGTIFIGVGSSDEHDLATRSRQESILRGHDAGVEKQSILKYSVAQG